ncbi:hypothetical protein FORMB_04330 [Formosa sp. Hel1_33_131]|nr:hypothetical protein FORMB_04330 [Formosa sp. Hel1_33_131]
MYRITKNEITPMSKNNPVNRTRKKLSMEKSISEKDQT